MENTSENKLQFFLQHIGCEVDISVTEYFQEQEKWNKPVTTCKVSGGRIDNLILFLQTNITSQNKGMLMLSPEVCTLLLKPLSSISDEDAVGVCKTTFIGHTMAKEDEQAYISDLKEELLGINLIIGVWRVQTYQILQSKGYALPWMGLSVDQQIEYGWIKLIEP